jgi:hypothetical protein
MAERRRHERQQPLPGGDRKDDPPMDGWLKPRDCADRLGVTPNFIIGEIRDGRLNALVIERPGSKAIYRIRTSSLQAYITRYGWGEQSA